MFMYMVLVVLCFGCAFLLYFTVLSVNDEPFLPGLHVPLNLVLSDQTLNVIIVRVCSCHLFCLLIDLDAACKYTQMCAHKHTHTHTHVHAYAFYNDLFVHCPVNLNFDT